MKIPLQNQIYRNQKRIRYFFDIHHILEILMKLHFMVEIIQNGRENLKIVHDFSTDFDAIIFYYS